MDISGSRWQCCTWQSSVMTSNGMIPSEVIADGASQTTSVEPHGVSVQGHPCQIVLHLFLRKNGKPWKTTTEWFIPVYSLLEVSGWRSGQTEQVHKLSSPSFWPIYGISFASSRLSTPFWSQGFEKNHREELAAGCWEPSAWSEWLTEPPFQLWFLRLVTLHEINCCIPSDCTACHWLIMLRIL